MHTQGQLKLTFSGRAKINPLLLDCSIIVFDYLTALLEHIYSNMITVPPSGTCSH